MCVSFHANPAIRSLAAGRMIVIYDGDSREAQGDIAFAGAFATTDKLNFCIKFGGGLVCLALTPEKASNLGVSRLPSNGKDPFATPFATPINSISASSGVSAADRSITILEASREQSTASSFYYPGHVSTLIGHPKGLDARHGHTEAILEMLKLSGVAGPGVLCEVLNENGDAASLPQLVQFAASHGLELVDIETILSLRER